MPQVTPEMFRQWLQHPVTQALHREVRQAQEELRQRLAEFERHPGAEPSDDKLRGAIFGMQQALDWSVMGEPEKFKQEASMTGY